mmetsp:Transcript_60560/g.88707  ORF Transcript_60560/g.88707 Transcript_60560/m.88707 type:complete len:128 (-) Transcript_60560:177-560(-)
MATHIAIHIATRTATHVATPIATLSTTASACHLLKLNLSMLGLHFGSSPLLTPVECGTQEARKGARRRGPIPCATRNMILIGVVWLKTKARWSREQVQQTEGKGYSTSFLALNSNEIGSRRTQITSC